MTMEERNGSIEDGARTISTGATITCSNPSGLKNKVHEFTNDASYPHQRSSKRSFDVAFLVAPDEKLIKRQSEKLANLQYCTDRLMNDALRLQKQVSINSEDFRDFESAGDRLPQNLTVKHFEPVKVRRSEEIQPPYVTPKRKLTSTPTNLSPEPPVSHVYSGPLKNPSTPDGFQRAHQGRKMFTGEIGNKNMFDCDSISCPDTRSAFTKVHISSSRNNLEDASPNLPYEDGTISPRSSVSPDVITYQNSLSPPIRGTGAFSPKYQSTSNFVNKTSGLPYSFLISPESAQQSTLLDNLKFNNQQTPKVPSPKIPTVAFRPEQLPASAPTGYPPMPYNPLSAVFPPIGEALARPRFLAAASLIPSSLAALALPSQNICAKCNLSFRMTSDLVYHMRSHHKSEHIGESARRRREEKLRCPVCDESFRERHHLTRHMTAHQDKESDAVVDQVDAKRRTAAATLLQGK